LEVIT